jgi:hypothetical protein
MDEQVTPEQRIERAFVRMPSDSDRLEQAIDAELARGLSPEQIAAAIFRAYGSAPTPDAMAPLIAALARRGAEGPP